MRLGVLFDQPEWTVRSEQMVKALGQALLRYPGSFGYWCRVLSLHVQGLTEVCFMGEESLEWMKQAGGLYLPSGVFLVLKKPVPGLERFSAHPSLERTSVQVCRKNTCSPPVFSPKELLIRLKNPDFLE
jgi:uncharacterized protein YyaL (SSP411 family)